MVAVLQSVMVGIQLTGLQIGALVVVCIGVTVATVNSFELSG